MSANHRWVPALFAALFVLVAGNVWAMGAPAPFKAGDVVKAAYRQVPIKVLDQQVAMVDFGRPITVHGVDGPWLWTSIEMNGKTINGWVYGEHVTAANAGMRFSYDPEQVYYPPPRK